MAGRYRNEESLPVPNEIPKEEVIARSVLHLPQNCKGSSQRRGEGRSTHEREMKDSSLRGSTSHPQFLGRPLVAVAWLIAMSNAVLLVPF